MDRTDQQPDRAPDGVRRLLDACTTPIGVDEIADAVLGAVRSLGAAGVVLVRVDPSGHISEVALAGESRRIAPTLGPLALTKRYPLIAAVLERRPLWLSSRSAMQAQFPEFAATRPGAEAIADLPLRSGDEVIGAIGIPFAAARPFSDVERTYLLSVAEITARALGALSISPEVAPHPDAAMLDRLHDAVMVIDHVADQVVYANAAAAELTGRACAELIGLSADALLERVVAPDDPFRTVVLGEVGWGVRHVEVARPDGTRRTSEVHVAERDTGGRRAFVAIDISDRPAGAPTEPSTDERIDRELHDRAVQAVFAASMGLAALAQAVRPALRPQVDALLDELDEVVTRLRTANGLPEPG